MTLSSARMAGVRRAGRRGQGRDRQRRDRQDEQHRDRPDRSAPKRLAPCRRPPTKNARPSTSRLLARIEPMSAVWTTTTRPAWSAKIEMNSSGRLPRADWRTPGRARPEPMPELVRPATDDPGQRRRGRPRDTTKTSPCGRIREAQDRGQDRRADAPRRAGRGSSGRGAPRSTAELAEGAVTLPMIRALPSGHAHQPARGRDEPVSPPARPQPGRLVSVGRRGAGPARGPRTSRSSCRSATRPATGATSWSASRSRTRRPPPS